MQDIHHAYDSNIDWTEAKRGVATSVGRASIAVGAPPEFGGDAASWSPEHLCVAALNSCMMLSFLAVAQNSKLTVSSYAATARGELEKVEGRGICLARIVVRPRITVPAGTDTAKVEQVLRIAKRNCFISNSLASEVTLEPEIVAQG